MKKLITLLVCLSATTAQARTFTEEEKTSFLDTAGTLLVYTQKCKGGDIDAVPVIVKSVVTRAINGAGADKLRPFVDKALKDVEARGTTYFCRHWGDAIAQFEKKEQSSSSMPQTNVNILRTRAGTARTTALPQFSNGKLYGCIVDFSVLMQDNIYRQGAFINVGGALGILSANNNLAVSLKVIVDDIDSGTMQLTPSPPASAYIVSGTTTTKPFFVAKVPSDTPGALFSVFNLEGAGPILFDGIRREKMVIAFNRREGGADIQVPIDLTVEDTAEGGRKTVSSKAAKEFLACTESLSESMGTDEKQSKR